MSSISGGIFSRPKGTTGGLVFGAARSRLGKVVTIREKVNPTNPNTAGQQTQRTKFSEVLDIVRTLGAVAYQTAWNRAVGQLPGFQSLMSTLLNQMDSSFDLNLTIPVNLGILHFPDTFTVTSPVASQIQFDWTAENGVNGTAADEVTILAIAQSQAVRAGGGKIVFQNTADRSTLQQIFSAFDTGDVVEVYAYMVGQGTAAGLLSIANPFEVTVS